MERGNEVEEGGREGERERESPGIACPHLPDTFNPRPVQLHLPKMLAVAACGLLEAIPAGMGKAVGWEMELGGGGGL